MTTRPGRVVLLSLLCLTTFATSASAEGAWVLWHQETRVLFKSPEVAVPPMVAPAVDPSRDDVKTSAWKPIDASSTEAGCRRAMKENVEAWGSVWRGKNTNFIGGGDSYLVTFTETLTNNTTVVQSYVRVQLRCFPDNVDPRGPKGN